MPPYCLGNDIPSQPFDPSFLLNSGSAAKTQESAAGTNSLLFIHSLINPLTSSRKLERSFVSLIEGKVNLDISYAFCLLNIINNLNYIE